MTKIANTEPKEGVSKEDLKSLVETLENRVSALEVQNSGQRIVIAQGMKAIKDIKKEPMGVYMVSCVC